MDGKASLRVCSACSRGLRGLGGFAGGGGSSNAELETAAGTFEGEPWLSSCEFAGSANVVDLGSGFVPSFVCEGDQISTRDQVPGETV
jgi:hypothetical protein